MYTIKWSWCCAVGWETSASWSCARKQFGAKTVRLAWNRFASAELGHKLRSTCNLANHLERVLLYYALQGRPNPTVSRPAGGKKKVQPQGDGPAEHALDALSQIWLHYHQGMLLNGPCAER